MKSIKSIIFISSLIIIGMVLLTVSSRSQEITVKPETTTQLNQPQETFTKLTVPGSEEVLTFLLPTELSPLEWLSNSDNTGRSPFLSSDIVINGVLYNETSLRIEQRPEHIQLQQSDEKHSNIPISIQFFSFSPALSPDFYYRNEYCELSETITQENIENIVVMLIKQKCHDSTQSAYGYWFEFGRKTIGFRSVVDEATEQPQYLKELLATFIRFNQKQ